MSASLSRPVFVLGRFPPPLDGQSIATSRLADLLDANHQVFRVNTEPDDGVTASDTRFRPGRIAHYLRLRTVIRDTLRTHPDAPVIWTAISSAALGHWRDILATLAVIEPSHPVFAVSHRSNLDVLFRSPHTAPSAKRMAERIDRFVFLTETISERCARWVASEKRLVIPNTIDDDLICSEDEISSHRRPSDPFRVLFLSNMMPEKGYEDVLEAVGITDSPVRATFVGAWPSDTARREFETRSRALGLSDRIENMGAISDRRHIKELLLESDAFVLPTYHPTEGMPLTIIEAMNAGTPIIATRAGGIPEMISENEHGLFVPDRAPREIAAAIQKLHDPDTWEKLSTGARDRFTQRFHPQVVRSMWESALA